MTKKYGIHFFKRFVNKKWQHSKSFLGSPNFLAYKNIKFVFKHNRGRCFSFQRNLFVNVKKNRFVIFI